MSLRRLSPVAILLGGVLLGATLFGAVGSADAHPLAPGLLELSEADDGVVEVRWTTSSVKARGAEFGPSLPEHCTGISAPIWREERDRVIRSWNVDCGAAGLKGQKVGVEGLATAYTDALLRVSLSDGRTFRTVLRARAPFATIPEEIRWFDVVEDYARLGFEHILSGWDHLAFLFGLLLLVGKGGPLVATITAFTVGHSITLSATVLGLIPRSAALIEIAIAVSIFLLAVELSRGVAAGSTLMQRRPWLVTSVFGLLHGAGFAGALAEIGLPETEIPLALFAFNVGIELGQLAFVFAVLAARRLARPALETLPAWTRWIPVQILGSLSVYWVLDRIAGSLG